MVENEDIKSISERVRKMAENKGRIIHPLGLMRVDEVLEILKIGKTSLYRGIQEGRYPKPLKLGLRTARWRASDVLAIIADHTPSQ